VCDCKPTFSWNSVNSVCECISPSKLDSNGNCVCPSKQDWNSDKTKCECLSTSNKMYLPIRLSMVIFRIFFNLCNKLSK
jgi:hypothetical protein